jgi:hypothetical protein
MILKIFSVYDAKAASYVTPFYQTTIGLAERIFTDEANNPESSLNKHAEDYTLFLIGEFDQNTAETTLEKTPKPLMKAIEVKRDA